MISENPEIINFINIIKQDALLSDHAKNLNKIVKLKEKVNEFKHKIRN